MGWDLCVWDVAVYRGLGERLRPCFQRVQGLLVIVVEVQGSG